MNIDIEHSHNQFMNSTKHQVEMGLKILNILFASNAGAIVAFLGFLSHKANENPLSNFWFFGVVSFVIGIGFILVAYTFSYFQQMAITVKYKSEYIYQRELEFYNNTLIPYNNMKNDPTVPVEFLTEQKLFLDQQFSSLKDRFSKIIIPFSDWRLGVAVVSATLSASCFLVGTMLILLGFR